MNAATQTAQTPIQLTPKLLEQWANDASGPVALHLKQKLAPVESIDGQGGVVYPPTYADVGYNIDKLSDGTNVAVIDSVGSQANRMEPVFKQQFNGKPLVPQIEIVLQDGKASSKNTDDAEIKEKRSVLDLAHRVADAVVQSSPTLKGHVEDAFQTLRRTGDAGPLCALAPTSLVFGVWDSRGGSNEKRPRLVRSIIRAWDVDELTAHSQFNSVWKFLDDKQKDELTKEAKSKKVKLSVKGFADAPAQGLGGVLVKGDVIRDVTINLVALRQIRGKTDDESARIRNYLLGLSLVAATADIDLFLREGCFLRYVDEDVWFAVPRRGVPQTIDLNSESAQTAALEFAVAGADYFRDRWPEQLEHLFDIKEAKRLLAKKDEADDQTG